MHRISPPAQPLVRVIAGLVALIVVAAACNAATESTEPAPMTAPPTTTTVPQTTTTTMPDATLSMDAPGDLAAQVEGLYDLALGHDRTPVLLAGLATHVGRSTADVPLSIEAVATTALLLDSHVAVVAWNDDVVLAVSDDGHAWTLVGASLPSVGLDPWFGDGPHQVFVIGSDARTREDPLKLRADSLHIVSVAADGSSASIVGIPRDTWVEASYGRNAKFTNTMSGRGPEVVVETGEMLTGLEFDGYVVTGFAGFVRLVNEFGGMEIDIPFAMNEPKSKAYFEAGRQMIDGAQALAFARNRTLAGGDFTRQFHHGVIMQWGLFAVQGKGIEQVPHHLELLTKHTFTDLEATNLLQLTAALFYLEPFEIPNLVVPGTPGWAGEASVVYLDEGAGDIFEDLADGVLDTIPDS